MGKVELEPSSHENQLNLDSADKISSGSFEFTLDIESSTDEEEISSKPFVPKVRIKKLDDSLLIETLVLKDVALTSRLFLILEEEKLEIVFEHQYRTQTKVSHKLQVKVQDGYNIEALEMKLCMWAGTPTKLSVDCTMAEDAADEVECTMAEDAADTDL
ncbi:hypothetical protein FRX31_016043 [Thalictrum thalictroides]|uniref:Uncharacterized protein n=1 Tax=Thalictrum thalictroides TaxID=46969 RepID=A0A7J6WAC2_THATH|nr:hypothetical protein FRX31_016043 [Thalictrum thalictroides]